MAFFIAVPLDREPSGTNKYSNEAYYAARENYYSCLTSKGMTPLALPYFDDEKALKRLFDSMSGLFLLGGGFDHDPALYDKDPHPTMELKKDRTAFERSCLNEALIRKMPILGICAGMQLLNIHLGGTLYQHLPEECPEAMRHEGTGNVLAHDIDVVPGTMLHAITQTARFSTNTSHHQAVKDAAPCFRISGRATDGVIECIEHEDHPFCMGVQWHPEFEIAPCDTLVLQAFADACRVYQNERENGVLDVKGGSISLA